MKPLRKIFIIFTLIIFSQLCAKKWNCMVYIAANNNLFRHGLKNIAEMKQIGSNQNMNIFVQLDNFGKKEVTRYKIEKGSAVQISAVKNPPVGISGTPENLFDFAKSIITNYPADHQALVLWNHGAGIKDPHIWSYKDMPHKRDELFCFNPNTKLLEVDKGVDSKTRGIAFNDVGKTYLTNKDLTITLDKIKTELLGGKKLDILGMDACHMAMIEIASQIKNSVNIMVGSQEIEPGTGWPYVQAFQPFLTQSFEPLDFAKLIVKAYGQRYNGRFADLTQSAIKLDNYDLLERNVDAVSTLLINIMKNQKNNHFTQLLAKIRSNDSFTTSFLDADYIDLTHFYNSILQQIPTYKSKNQEKIDVQANLVEKLKQTLTDGLAILKELIIENSSGTKAPNAHGLSIYFPTKTIHSSYLKTEFAKNTNWCNFLYTHLKIRKKELF